MTKTQGTPLFGQEQANIYDDRWKKLAPMSNGLHFLSRMALQDLPQNADVLCIGVGTGAELLALAAGFPNFTFTAVEPSAPMLSICQSKVENAGFSSRCRFHEGYLESLPVTQPFDAATAILVSQFMPQVDKRQAFFREILQRLKPDSILISADLASTTEPEAYDQLLQIWAQSLMHADFTREAAMASTAAWGKEVAVSRPKEIEDIITASGFKNPTLFYQSLFIHAWFSKAPGS